MDEMSLMDGVGQPEIAPEPEPAKDFGRWRGRLEASRRVRRDLMEVWKNSVRFRVQKPYNQQADQTQAQDRTASPEDWARSKQKAALLNFQLPKILAEATIPQQRPKAPMVTAAVNEVLRKEARASYMIDECLADVINAAGIAVSQLGVEERWEDVQVEVPGEPLMDETGMQQLDPMTGQPMMSEPTMDLVPRLVSRRFFWERVSPANFLWPTGFTGSDWDQAPWLAVDDYPTKSDIARQYGDEVADQAEVSGGEEGDAETAASPHETLATDLLNGDDQMSTLSEVVRRTTVWIRAAKFDPNVSNEQTLRKLVFLAGLEDPVEDEMEPWQEWQEEIPEQPAQQTPDGRMIPADPGRPGYYKGLTGFPIRVMTLTYVSDLAVPPSDSQAGRPQVRELIRSRSQMLRQRDSSLPLRWYDVNRLDEEIAELIRTGQWQDMIPTNGPGSNVIGEVARANYPRENFQFQNILNNDLDRSWSLSNNALAVTNMGKKSATEINAINGASQVRLDYEKFRVNRFIAEGAAQLFGLMQLVGDRAMYVTLVGPEGADLLTRVMPTEIDGPYSFTFLSDSSDRVDPLARQDKALKVWNLMAQAPGINRQALAEEVLLSHGFDPSKILVPEPKQGPPPPKISFTFKGEDLLNPFAVATMMKAGYVVEQKDIDAAVAMIADAASKLRAASLDPLAAQPQGGGAGAPPGPGGPGAPAQIEGAPVQEPILKRGAAGERLV